MSNERTISYFLKGSLEGEPYSRLRAAVACEYRFIRPSLEVLNDDVGGRSNWLKVHIPKGVGNEQAERLACFVGGFLHGLDL